MSDGNLSCLVLAVDLVADFVSGAAVQGKCHLHPYCETFLQSLEHLWTLGAQQDLVLGQYSHEMVVEVLVRREMS